jgi:glycosyltransferase involved in cell wall biosynthesis
VQSHWLSSIRFAALQLQDILLEHVLIRRGRSELSDVLSAYGALHNRRPRSVPAETGQLTSIVVPCYNHAALLETTLESIAGQTWRPLEVVFVDDASTDATAQALPELVAGLPSDIQTQVHRRRQNHGQSSAINFGVLRARGSVVTILNDDDYLLHDAIALARQVMAREGVHLIGTTSTWFEDEVPAQREVGLDGAEIPVIRLAPKDVFRNPALLRLTHSGSTFTRAAWFAVRGYRARRQVRIVVPGDTDFHQRLGSLFPVAVVPSIPFAYWRHSAQSHDSELFS